MKPFFLLLLTALPLWGAVPVGPATNTVTLAWTASPDPGPLSYRIYSSTNAAAPMPWTVVTNVPGTQTTVSFLVSKIACFYYATVVSSATNAGAVIERESDPSNVALDPWPNQGYGLKISQ